MITEDVMRLNKAIFTLFATFCLFSTLFLVKCEISVKASGNVVHVPTQYLTIQEAINHASSGGSIFVHSGTYYEHVVVNKSIFLIGECIESTLIDGENKPGKVISITASNVSIQGFTIKGSRARPYDCGIFVDHSNGIDISHNTITGNNDGVSFYSSSANVVSDNTITSNYYGISFYYSSANIVSSNTITGNNDGVSFYSSSANVVSDNTITSNYYGISLDYSSANIVSSNTITENYYGIHFTLYSSNNTICHNNFNNTCHVWSDSTNVWNDSNEGNYWSNYTGQDTNGDGIGDTPYVINMGNQDNYPLMGMFSNFIVTLEGKLYHIATVCNSTISDFRFEIGSETGNKMIRFNVTGQDGTVGFCRIMVPTELMNYPYIVLVGVEEIIPTLLDVSNETFAYLYFTYVHSSHSIAIIASKTLYLYNELLDKHVKLQMGLYNLNTTYYDLLKNYSILLGNYSQLQESYRQLNDSYQEHLLDYSETIHNIRNLVQIFAATTAIFLITIIYLSKRAHASKTIMR